MYSGKDRPYGQPEGSSSGLGNENVSNSNGTARARRATLESQPLHVGFDVDEPLNAGVSSNVGGDGGVFHEPYDSVHDNGQSTGLRLAGAYDDSGATHQVGLDDALLKMKKRTWIRDAAITGLFIIAWYFFSTLLSLYNKWMFTPEYYGFSYPLFVTMCHQIVQFGLAFAVRRIFPSLRPKERPQKYDYMTKVVPTAATTGLDIGLSNLSLKTVTLTLYTMCKSSTLIFVLVFAFLFRLEAFSIRLIIVISFISIGVFMMVFDTTAVSIPGIIMIFTASAMGGLRWALTQMAMNKQEMGMTNPFATIYWLAPLMALTLALVSLIFEGWIQVFSGPFFQGIQFFETVALIVLPGAVAFAMVASEYYIIQRSGIVPLSVAGIFKEVTTIAISSWVFGDELTHLNMVGVAVTVIGIATYSYHKYQKSVLEDANHHHQHHRDPATLPSEGDGFAPLLEQGEGPDCEDMLMTERNRQKGQQRMDELETYILGDEDEEEGLMPADERQLHKSKEKPKYRDREHE